MDRDELIRMITVGVVAAAALMLTTTALLAPVAYSDGTWAACSGTLISPTVFLTRLTVI